MATDDAAGPAEFVGYGKIRDTTGCIGEGITEEVIDYLARYNEASCRRLAKQFRAMADYLDGRRATPWGGA